VAAFLLEGTSPLQAEEAQSMKISGIQWTSLRFDETADADLREMEGRVRRFISGELLILDDLDEETMDTLDHFWAAVIKKIPGLKTTPEDLAHARALGYRAALARADDKAPGLVLLGPDMAPPEVRQSRFFEATPDPEEWLPLCWAHRQNLRDYADIHGLGERFFVLHKGRRKVYVMTGLTGDLTCLRLAEDGDRAIHVVVLR
jgi:hypothetical protein